MTHSHDYMNTGIKRRYITGTDHFLWRLMPTQTCRNHLKVYFMAPVTATKVFCFQSFVDTGLPSALSSDSSKLLAVGENVGLQDYSVVGITGSVDFEEYDARAYPKGLVNLVTAVDMFKPH